MLTTQIITSYNIHNQSFIVNPADPSHQQNLGYNTTLHNTKQNMSLSTTYQ